MSNPTWRSNQIEVEVSGFFTTHHTFETAAGLLGELTMPAFGQQGTFRFSDGRELYVRKTSWLGNSHQLLDGESVRGTADQAGLFRRDILVHLNGQDYVLEPAGIFSRGWFLLDAAETTLVEIEPRGILRQGLFLTLHAEIAPELVVFVYYLVFTRQQEEAAGAAAATGAAAS
jgi:hypothetical protein